MDPRVIPFYGAEEPALFEIERRAMDRDGVVIGWLHEHLPRGLVLDVGAGDGFTATRLSTDERTVVALEPAPGMVGPVEGRSRLVWVRGVAQDLPFHDGTFDGVYATWAYFFANRSDLDDGLAEARRVLRPGGTLVLVDNAGDDGLAALSPRPLASDPEVFRARGFAVTRLRTAYKFDDPEQARALLGRYFGPEVAGSFEGTEVDHQVFVYTWTKSVGTP